MQYTVQKGDTLSGIGAKYGVDWHNITGYASGNPNVIRVGEVLNVPDSKTPAATSTPTNTPTNSPSTVNASINNGSPKTVQDLINMGYSGYQGWDDANAIADFNATGGSGKKSSGSSSPTSTTDLAGLLNPNQSVDLTSIYDQAYKDAGISDLEAELAKKQSDLTDAEKKVTNNPFLDATEQGGRVTTLKGLANQEITNLQNQITLKKADVETKVNLAAKQIDVNSSKAETALSTLNTLLGMGAFSTATASDIAGISTATGLSTSAIQNLISSAKTKNQETTIQSFDDGTNQGYAVIDTKTGDLIKKVTIGTSKKTGSGTSTTQEYKDLAISDASNGTTIGDLIKIYSGVMSVKDIYNIYRTYTTWGNGEVSASSTPANIVQLLKDNGITVNP